MHQLVEININQTNKEDILRSIALLYVALYAIKKDTERNTDKEAIRKIR